jgi:hypothetical protein
MVQTYAAMCERIGKAADAAAGAGCCAAGATHRTHDSDESSCCSAVGGGADAASQSIGLVDSSSSSSSSSGSGTEWQGVCIDDSVYAATLQVLTHGFLQLPQGRLDAAAAAHAAAGLVATVNSFLSRPWRRLAYHAVPWGSKVQCTCGGHIPHVACPTGVVVSTFWPLSPYPSLYFVYFLVYCLIHHCLRP